MTAVGYRPYPSASELTAVLRGESVRLPAIAAAIPERFPVLITAPWCPFTVPASRFWSEAAAASGRTLHAVDAESEEGAGMIAATGAAGVPCLVAAPGRLRYGYQLTPAAATAFIAVGAEPPPLSP